MKLIIIKSEVVCNNNELFVIHIGYKDYDLGFQIHDWGIRIMAIWWHLCIRFK